MKVCVVIPARYQSTRFPGKPLALIHKREMILWVAELSARAVGKAHVFIATDSELIVECVENEGYNAILTSSECMTGTDRVAEAAQGLDYDVFINVQGDEPMLNPIDIKKCIEVKKNNPEQVVCGYNWMTEGEDPESKHIPKVVMNETEDLIYMSRQAIPGFKSKSDSPDKYAKQVCIYGFTAEDLDLYKGFGRKSATEKCEDIEIIRFFDVGKKIKMFEAFPGSLAVDNPGDIENVESAMANK